MPKQNDYTLSKEELEQVRVAMKSHKAKVAKRASVVHSLHLGYAPEEAAELHQISLGTVYNHYNRFREEGAQGLSDKPIPGRPPKATDEYITILEDTLESNPQDKGFAFTIWTQARLRQYLTEQTGISLSRSRFQDLMTRLNYVYRRPKYDVGHKQDAQLRQQVSDALDELKKEPKHKKSNYSLWMKP